MSVLEIIGLFVAGIGAGLTGSVAGLASLVSYPALLAVGLSPVSANVTNTVGLLFSSIGSISASRPELAGQRERMRRLVPVGALGGLVGGILLLVTPSGDFKRLVPCLIGLASLAMLSGRRLSGAAVASPVAERLIGPPSPRARLRKVGLSAAVFAIGVYGGYFGAAAGVVLLALLLFATSETLARASGAKNLILGVANGVAALLFVFDSPVRWSAAVPLATGLLIGGRLGPSVIRRTPARPLQLIIAVAGVGLAVFLGVQAYT